MYNHKAYLATWQPAHRAEVAMYNATRKFGEAVSREEWLPIWNGSCFRCGKTPAEGVDHIVSFSREGRNVVENLQPACLFCNVSKGADRE